jgi:radical SAM superfamily enzyme YgiQ (UPF0313 family)
MKILLIDPPPRVRTASNIRILGSLGQYKGDFCWPPLDLTIIAGLLRKNKIDSEIFDANVNRSSLDNVKKKVKHTNADVVIFLTSTSTIYGDLSVARAAKEVSEDIVTVAIGTHVAVLAEETLKMCEDLDIVVSDPEPELPILSLVLNDLDPRRSEGVCYRNGGSFKRNPSRKLMNLDELGIPAHDKLNLNLYSDPLMKRKPMALTYTSRGCRWGKCMYCCNPFFYQPLRFRSISTVIKELKWLNELGVKEIKWFDPELNHELKYTYELCDRMIKEGIDLTWSADVRADMLPIELLEKMKEAGCHTLLIGVESGDPSILSAIPKGITRAQAKEAVKNIKRVGISVITHFMLGLPGETKETMMRTLEFAKELDPDATTFGIATPHPGTAFYDFIEKNGFFVTKDFSKFDTCLPPVYNYPQLTSDQIFKFMRCAYRSFYFRPTYILKRLLKIKSLVEFENEIKNFLYLFKRYWF